MMQAIAKEQLENESSAYYCSSRILDDGIIDPRDTRYTTSLLIFYYPYNLLLIRSVVGICLSVLYSAPVHGTESYGISRM